MTIQLTPEQWTDISRHDGELVRVSDPSQCESFILLRSEVYERFKALFEGAPVSDQERIFELQQFGQRAGWDDPAMNVYDDLDPRRKS